jgi:hypothetical protein
MQFPAPSGTSRSRWLVAAMLAFHDESKQIARPTTWELRLSDGAFAARAESRPHHHHLRTGKRADGPEPDELATSDRQ